MNNTQTKVLLVPKEKDLQRITKTPDATVEAEYGETVLEGKHVTLAHHVEKYKNNPAPCMSKVRPLREGSTIVISHIDLDALGGVLGLLGLKPKDDDFWRAVEYIDVNGVHHIRKFPDQKRKIEAYWAWMSFNCRTEKEGVTDVTDMILRQHKVIKRILSGDQKLLWDGERWSKGLKKKVERCLVEEDQNVRVFITNDIFCSSSYYSPKQARNVPITITYKTADSSIRLATCEKTINVKEIMQELFGLEAGGKSGIAGSPKGRRMTRYDFERVVKRVKKIFEMSKVS